MNEYVRTCARFARDHHLKFVEIGEVGFGRPCVGFTKGAGYVALNPHSSANYEDLWSIDERLSAPRGVSAYHKYDCLAMLVDGADYDAGVRGLYTWIRTLEAIGELETVAFETGATGLQAMFSGVVGVALRFVRPAGTPEPSAVLGMPCISIECRSVATKRVVSWPVSPSEDFPIYCDACATTSRGVLEALGHKYHDEPLPVRAVRQRSRAVSTRGQIGEANV